jgi:predicted SprT family Zn-dependent metalloprotease
MEISVEYITERFREYNKDVFNHVLPLPQIRLMRSYRYSGRFSCKKPVGRRRLKEPRIEISCYFDWREEDFRNVLLHEMLHYYLAFTHIDNAVTHGEAFLEHAKEINEKHGCNITVLMDTASFKRAAKAPKLSWFFARVFG